jgi:hypothetical protein
MPCLWRDARGAPSHLFVMRHEEAPGYNAAMLKRFSLPALMLASFLLGTALTGTAFAYQGHMWNAKDALVRAQTQLQVALPDKAGHREAALDLVGRAISQVDMGIAAGAR